MKKYLVAAVFIFSCMPSFAFESYEGYYIEQSIQAYQTVADAIEARRETQGSSEARAILSNYMNNFIVQRNGLRKARNIFDQFKESKNYSIRASSTLMSANLMLIETQIDVAIKQIEKLLNLSNTDLLQQTGTSIKEIQETAASIDNAWEGYVKASGAVPAALIEGMEKNPMLENKDRARDKMTKLVVSRKFVNDTKKSINTRFKGVIEKYNKGDYDNIRQYQIPPIILYQFLSDRWKTIDEK